jgi:hypothetical protein
MDATKAYRTENSIDFITRIKLIDSTLNPTS